MHKPTHLHPQQLKHYSDAATATYVHQCGRVRTRVCNHELAESKVYRKTLVNASCATITFGWKHVRYHGTCPIVCMALRLCVYTCHWSIKRRALAANRGWPLPLSLNPYSEALTWVCIQTSTGRYRSLTETCAAAPSFTVGENKPIMDAGDKIGTRHVYSQGGRVQ